MVATKPIFFIFLISLFLSVVNADCIGATTNFSCGSAITESCTLNESVICSGSDGYDVGSDNIVIDGANFTLSSDDNTLGYIGIYNPSYTNVSIANLNIENYTEGIEADGGSYLYLSNLTIFHNGDSGIYFYGASFLYIDNIIIYDNYFGAYFDTSSNISLSNITIFAMDGVNYFIMDGIDVYNVNVITIENTDISGFHSDGIIGSATNNALIQNNYINGTNTEGENGLNVLPSLSHIPGFTIKYFNNTLENLDIGILIPAFGTITYNPCSGANSFTYMSIINNTIKNAALGIYAHGSIGSVIYNNFINATVPVSEATYLGTCFPKGRYSLAASPNYWNGTKGSYFDNTTNIIGGRFMGGNFYAQPDGLGYSENCTDINKDGICDNPYLIPYNGLEHDYDYLPLTFYNEKDNTIARLMGAANSCSQDFGIILYIVVLVLGIIIGVAYFNLKGSLRA